MFACSRCPGPRGSPEGAAAPGWRWPLCCIPAVPHPPSSARRAPVSGILLPAEGMDGGQKRGGVLWLPRGWLRIQAGVRSGERLG